MGSRPRWRGYFAQDARQESTAKRYLESTLWKATTKWITRNVSSKQYRGSTTSQVFRFSQVVMGFASKAALSRRRQSERRCRRRVSRVQLATLKGALLACGRSVLSLPFLLRFEVLWTGRHVAYSARSGTNPAACMAYLPLSSRHRSNPSIHRGRAGCLPGVPRHPKPRS